MEPAEVENAVAIIGMAGQFPGASTIQQFWNNISQGIESLTRFSEEQLKIAGISESLIRSPKYVKVRGVLEGIEKFDADFFGMSAKEAQLTDPQHRLFLECAWESLEDAGYNPDTFPGLIGVYGGTGMSSYFLNNIYPNQSLRERHGDYLLHIGNEKDFLATRVSYKLNLKGPSLTIQTACSTSLVAVCVACNHLLTYQCDMALAGGVAISVPQESGYIYQEGMIYSADGHCKPFDADAKGTVPGNGVGIVVLKRLEDAIADRDHIYAVIRGYGINNDGMEKIGYSAPSVEGQADAILSAIEMSEVNPETIGYMEAHGTATFLGDPIEIKALTQAFRTHTQNKRYCALSSVKSNIGHLIEAAGIAGLIKAALSLHHKLLPPTMHFDTPNPNIDFAASPFYVNTHLKEWHAGPTPRRACVSSFGIGGTNANVVLEEKPVSLSTSSLRPGHLLVLSAKTPTALKTMAANLRDHLLKHPTLPMTKVAYTLQVGRKAFENRHFIVCDNAIDAISSLSECDVKTVSFKPSVVFIFPKSANMQLGQELYKQEPIYRHYLDKCSKYASHINHNIELFVAEYALAHLWQAWGVVPQAMIGEEIGEYVVACLTNEMTLEEALEIVSSEGQLPTLQRKELVDDPSRLFVEIKPDTTLAMLSKLGELWAAGVSVDWEGFNKHEEHYRIPLPTYPFEKKRYWIDPPTIVDKSQPIVSKEINISPEAIEASLLIIWQDYIGKESINVDDDFFRLGGDSLLAIQIICKINATFNTTLPFQTLLEFPSIAKLTTIIYQQLEAIQDTNGTLSSILVKLKEGRGEPLFLIHPIGGHVFCYKHLVECLAFKGPIYGIKAPHFREQSSSIEEIASYYIKAIQKMQPKGPYYLLGASFGGLIGYEIARQLKEADQSIGILAMLDIIRPESNPQQSADDMSMLALLIELFEGKPVSDIKELPLKDQIRRLMDSMGLGELSFSEQEKVFEQVKIHCHALRLYHPKPYHGKVIFFQAKEQFFRTKNISLGETWKDLVEAIEVYEVPGNHLSMLMNPQVKILASLLNFYYNPPSI